MTQKFNLTMTKRTFIALEGSHRLFSAWFKKEWNSTWVYLSNWTLQVVYYIHNIPTIQLLCNFYQFSNGSFLCFFPFIQPLELWILVVIHCFVMAVGLVTVVMIVCSVDYLLLLIISCLWKKRNNLIVEENGSLLKMKEGVEDEIGCQPNNYNCYMLFPCISSTLPHFQES